MDGERWLALGDSITWGFPEGPHVSWTHHAAAALGMAVDNHGVNGDTLDGMYERLTMLFLQRTYRFAVFMGGSNDVFWGFTPAVLERNAACIGELLTARGIPFAVGMPIPLLADERAEKRLAQFRGWLRGAFAHVIDFPGAFPVAEVASLLPDGVHPSPEGYRRMALAALPVLRPLST